MIGSSQAVRIPKGFRFGCGVVVFEEGSRAGADGSQGQRFEAMRDSLSEFTGFHGREEPGEIGKRAGWNEIHARYQHRIENTSGAVRSRRSRRCEAHAARGPLPFGHQLSDCSSGARSPPHPGPRNRPSAGEVPEPDSGFGLSRCADRTTPGSGPVWKNRG